MSFSAFAGVFLTLAIVLGLIAVTMRLLRRVAVGAGAGRGTVRLEVMQRISLGPRQGIAVVRVGSQVVAVSVGDGGIRALIEVPAEDVADAADAPHGVPTSVVRAGREARTANAAHVAARTAAPAPFAGNSLVGSPVRTDVAPPTRDFRALLRDGLRTAGVPFVALAIALALPAHHATAQAATTAAPPARPVTPAATAPGQQQTTPAPAAPRGVLPAAGPQATTVRQPSAAAATPATVAAPAPGASLDQLASRAPQMDLKVGGGAAEGGLHLSGTVGIVVMMGLLTLLPTLLLMMTGFTRILIVLHFLRQAIGAQSAPPAQLVSALALLLTGFVMMPTLTEVNRTALTPWLDGRIEQGAMMSAAIVPFREFMLRQTREKDLVAFVEMSRAPRPARIEDTPTVVLMSAFVTSELRTAFQLGFALFLPFIVIDIVVSSVLMSMGMMMLPPALISLPFKLLLFVLVDGWTLVIQGVVAGFK